MADAKKKASSAGRELGRLGARKGGRARARALTPAERSEIARRAVRARWAKSGKVVTPPSDRAARNETARSLFRGPLTVAGVELEAHVLADGRRVLDHDGVVEVFTGGSDPGGLDRGLDKFPDDGRGLLALPVVWFRVPGRAGTVSGFESGQVVAVADRLLSARAAGPLKKQPTRMAAVAETVVRAAAATGIDGLVDEATGYANVRGRQSAQRTIQAYLAEDVGRWAARFPKEFWAELARLHGVSSPKSRPVGWARYVVLFVGDAVDADVGRELRRPSAESAFRPTLLQWLDEIGRARLDSRMDSIVSAMRRCADVDEFESMFAKVLHKGPSHAQLPEDVRRPDPETIGGVVGLRADDTQR